MLKNLGFDVVRDDNNRYALNAEPTFDSPSFTAQEAQYLKRLVQTSGRKVQLNASILQKLAHLQDDPLSTNLIVQAQVGQWIETISNAIIDKKQIKIEQYASANSLSISDRIIEPICFTDNYRSIAAFELETERCKFFNLERMGNVVLLEKKFAHEAKHEFKPPDAFGFQGDQSNKFIDLSMNLRAYLILKEEYPMCIARIVNKDNYHLKIKVQGFMAPARFVKGMKDDVKVLGSKAFIDYLKE